jgi:hypothetical protein
MVLYFQKKNVFVSVCFKKKIITQVSTFDSYIMLCNNTSTHYKINNVKTLLDFKKKCLYNQFFMIYEGPIFVIFKFYLNFIYLS